MISCTVRRDRVPAFAIAVLVFAVMMVSLAPAMGDQHGGKVIFTRLSDSVWMHTSYRRFLGIGPIPANGLIVFDGDASILVDSAWTNEQTQAVLNWASDEAHHPITRAIFTHAHVDKMGGVAVIRKNGIETFAATLTNSHAGRRGLTRAEFDIELQANGRVVSFGPVDLFFPGAGHSPDNIVVDVPDDGILFGGCLIRPGPANSLGNTRDAAVGNWAAAVRAVAARFPRSDIVIPTHGSPGSRALLDHTIHLARTATGD